MLSTLLCFLLAAPAPVYKIMFHFFPAERHAVRVRGTEAFNDVITLPDKLGKETQKTMGEEKTFDYVEKMIAVERNEPIEFTREYTLPKDKSYSGRLVRFVRDRGEIRVTGNGISLADLEDLKRSEKTSGLDIDRAMMPPKPVAVGDTWTVDPTLIATALDFTGLDRNDSVAKLVSVTDVGGHPVAVIEVKLDMVMKPDEKGVFPSPTHFVGTMRYEGAIDGSSTLSREMLQAAFKAEQVVKRRDGTEVKVHHDFKVGIDQKTEDLR